MKDLRKRQTFTQMNTVNTDDCDKNGFFEANQGAISSKVAKFCPDGGPAEPVKPKEDFDVYQNGQKVQKSENMNQVTLNLESSESPKDEDFNLEALPQGLYGLNTQEETKPSLMLGMKESNLEGSANCKKRRNRKNPR